MAPAATVEKDSQWKIFLFSLEAASEVGLSVCAENLAWIKGLIVFPYSHDWDGMEVSSLIKQGLYTNSSSHLCSWGYFGSCTYC